MTTKARLQSPSQRPGFSPHPEGQASAPTPKARLQPGEGALAHAVTSAAWRIRQSPHNLPAVGTRFHPIATNYPHFVTTTIRDRRPVFVDDRASSLLIEILEASRTETGTQLLAYVVMPDHVHLLVVPGRLGLGHFMRLVKGRFARYWNRSEGQPGALWQERYYETVIRTDAGLKRCIDYIHRNPVASGLSEDASAYPYSSASRRHIPSDLMSYLTESDTGQAEAWPSDAGMAQRPSGAGAAVGD